MRRLLRHPGCLGLVAAVASIVACRHEVNMTQADLGRPEPVLFLLEAADAMESYRSAHGAYAREWPDLNIEFVNGPYRVTDPDIRPPVGAGNVWRPKNAKHTYRIVSADRQHFLIQAVNANGRVDYEMKDGMKDPREVNR